MLVLLPTLVSTPAHQAVSTPASAAEGKVSSLHLSLTLAAPGVFKLLFTCTGGVLPPGQFCLELEHSLVLKDGAADGGGWIMGQSCG